MSLQNDVIADYCLVDLLHAGGMSCLAVESEYCAPGSALAAFKLPMHLKPCLPVIEQARKAETASVAGWRIHARLDDQPLPVGLAALGLLLAERCARGVYWPTSPRLLCCAGLNQQLQIVAIDEHEQAMAALAAMPETGNAILILPASAPVDSAKLAACHPRLQLLRVDSLASLDRYFGLQRVREARVYFPVVGQQDALQLLHLQLRALAQPGGQCTTEMRSPQGIASQQAEAIHLLAALRAQDAGADQNWQTRIRLSCDIVGESYQLALLLADRIARGREWPAAGRIFATGAIDPATLQVCEVAGLEAKCETLLQAARRGDCVLLPAAWQPLVASTWPREMALRGAQLVWLDVLLPVSAGSHGTNEWRKSAQKTGSEA